MSFAIVFRAEEIFIQIVIIYNWYMFLLCVGKCFTDSALCAVVARGGRGEQECVETVIDRA